MFKTLHIGMKNNMIVVYCDDTWAMLQFENIKLALVVKEEHPPHIAFEVDKMDDDWPMKGKLHRDGSISKYVEDPSGNKIELIEYPKEYDGRNKKE